MAAVPFPHMSDDASAKGVVSTWFVEPGEQVGPETLIAEVAVDKVDMEVYPPAAGTITLLVPEGEEVSQGTPIARVE
ncbi:MAG: lipoyl domain-containing protein [Streptosporangiales bacterium]|jgi:pyruvate/2-oxoglutarate dehydrogenase complex dihydrolipoamide acyltransferase (E2) component|nr:lipoyl domain-containing protein [Streptosporangiales bacterium]